MPGFKRPPDPDDPELFSMLVRGSTARCSRWARSMDRRYPGEDFGPEANIALWRAAATFDPALGYPFAKYLTWRLADVRSAVLLKRRRRLRAARGICPAPGAEVCRPRLFDDEPDFAARIAPLPAKLRRVLELHYGAGLSFRQIEAETGLNFQVAARLNLKAIRQLRKLECLKSGAR